VLVEDSLEELAPSCTMSAIWQMIFCLWSLMRCCVGSQVCNCLVREEEEVVQHGTEEEAADARFFTRAGVGIGNLVAVLISTEEVVRARQMKVGGAVAQLRGHGRGPPEHCNRAGLTWNTAVGREADMAEVGLIQSLDGELICGVAVLLIFFSSI